MARTAAPAARRQRWLQKIMCVLLILSARAALCDRLHGLDACADDYLTKPFAFEELASRLRAITRRVKEPLQDDRLVVGNLVLDRRMRVVTHGGRPLTLPPREFALLEFLMQHPGQVMTRTILLEHVWDYGFDPLANVVDVAIWRLRKAVDDGEERPLIHTVRRVGYKIQDGA